jgi:hypothetical protein
MECHSKNNVTQTHFEADNVADNKHFKQPRKFNTFTKFHCKLQLQASTGSWGCLQSLITILQIYFYCSKVHKE